MKIYFIQNDYQIAQGQLARIDTTRFNNIEQQYVEIIETFIGQLSGYLQTNYKFHPITTKLNPRKIPRSLHVQTPIEHNLHRADSNRRTTLLAELSSLNNVQIVLRFLQYDIIKIQINNQQSPAINHLRQVEKKLSLFLIENCVFFCLDF